MKKITRSHVRRVQSCNTSVIYARAFTCPTGSGNFVVFEKFILANQHQIALEIMLLLNHIVIKATSLIMGGRSQNFKKTRACLDVKF